MKERDQFIEASNVSWDDPFTTKKVSVSYDYKNTLTTDGIKRSGIIETTEPIFDGNSQPCPPFQPYVDALKAIDPWIMLQQKLDSKNAKRKHFKKYTMRRSRKLARPSSQRGGLRE